MNIVDILVTIIVVTILVTIVLAVVTYIAYKLRLARRPSGAGTETAASRYFELHIPPEGQADSAASGGVGARAGAAGARSAAGAGALAAAGAGVPSGGARDGNGALGADPVPAASGNGVEVTAGPTAPDSADESSAEPAPQPWEPAASDLDTPAGRSG